VLGVSPFSDTVLDLNEAQLDLILVMESRDKPKELKFERRADILAKMRMQTEMTSRANVLTGTAKKAMYEQVSFKLPAAYTTPARGVLKRHDPPAAPAAAPAAKAPPKPAGKPSGKA
jgi:hypothetical protein